MMRSLLVVLILLALLAACEATSNDAVPTSPLIAAQAADAQLTADAARVQAQGLAARATAVAQATRDALSAEVTRQALANQASQATRDARATEQARAAIQTAASDARTGTAVARTMTATAETGHAQETSEARRATAAAEAELVRETAAARRDTEAARLQTATIEAAAGQATQTRIANAIKQEQDSANMRALLAQVGEILQAVGLWLFIAALVVIALYSVRRLFRAGEDLLRARTEETRAATAMSLVLRSGAGDIAGLLEPTSNGGFIYRPIVEALPPALPPLQQLPAETASSSFADLEARPLDLTHQPGGLPPQIPIGMTARGEKWIPLRSHMIIGGATGMGKSSFVHGVIQALGQCEQAEMFLFDGKRGKHFRRYQGERAHVAEQLLAPLTAKLIEEMNRREERLRESGATDIEEYNKLTSLHDHWPYLVMIIDELPVALGQLGVLQDLQSLAQLGRECGIRLVMAVQVLDGRTVPAALRDNCLARIAFRVPRHEASRAILGFGGAEQLPELPGRLLASVGGMQFYAQAFTVDLPDAPVQGASNGSVLPFNDLEMQILAMAAAGEGWLLVKEIATALHIDDTVVTELGDRLEQRGWCTGMLRERGRYKGRKLTDDFLRLISTVSHGASNGGQRLVA